MYFLRPECIPLLQFLNAGAFLPALYFGNVRTSILHNFHKFRSFRKSHKFCAELPPVHFGGKKIVPVLLHKSRVNVVGILAVVVVPLVRPRRDRGFPRLVPAAVVPQYSFDYLLRACMGNVYKKSRYGLEQVLCKSSPVRHIGVRDLHFKISHNAVIRVYGVRCPVYDDSAGQLCRKAYHVPISPVSLSRALAGAVAKYVYSSGAAPTLES